MFLLLLFVVLILFQILFSLIILSRLFFKLFLLLLWQNYFGDLAEFKSPKFFVWVIFGEFVKNVLHLFIKLHLNQFLDQGTFLVFMSERHFLLYYIDV
jgi:hypothetical protein